MTPVGTHGPARVEHAALRVFSSKIYNFRFAIRMSRTAWLCSTDVAGNAVPSTTPKPFKADLSYLSSGSFLLHRGMPRTSADAQAVSDGETLAAIVSAAAVAVSGLLAFLAYEFGPHATHMALHIALMSLLAPVAAIAAAGRLRCWLRGPSALWMAAGAQLMLLWAWHVPAIQRVVLVSSGLNVAAHALLFICSFVFWGAVIRAQRDTRWHAVAALLLTGKLTCLLSALLIFSPRALYDAGHHAGRHLDDQQLAGLLMITACPLSYLIAAVVIVARLVNGPARVMRPDISSTG